MMHGILTGDIHYWHNTDNQCLVSIEPIKKLLSFDSVDDVINWLFMNDYKEASRELNNRKKG